MGIVGKSGQFPVDPVKVAQLGQAFEFLADDWAEVTPGEEYTLTITFPVLWLSAFGPAYIINSAGENVDCLVERSPSTSTVVLRGMEAFDGEVGFSR